MNKLKVAEKGFKDSENHEGLMANSNEEFQMLIRNKAVKTFARAEAKSRPVKLDLLLTKLYLAL
jgi:hypothetical protein